MGRIVIRAEGPQGSGKSAALMAISDALHAKGYRMSNSIEDEHAIIARTPDTAQADQARRAAAPKTSDEIYDVTQILGDTLDRITHARHRLAELASTPDPLPAPSLTEDAIVAALKADPAMAAEVLVTLGFTMDRNWRLVVRDRAQLCCQYASPQTLRSGLQSLAVALAAASYRG